MDSKVWILITVGIIAVILGILLIVIYFMRKRRTETYTTSIDESQRIEKLRSSVSEKSIPNEKQVSSIKTNELKNEKTNAKQVKTCGQTEGQKEDEVPQESEDTNVRRQKWKCQEVIAEALDVLWATNGRYIWTAQKQMFCPNLITKEDEKEVTCIINKLKPLTETLDNFRITFRLSKNPKVFDDISNRVDRISTDILKLSTLCEELKNKINGTEK